MLRTFEEQLALARVARQRCCALKLPAGFFKAAELLQKVSAHAWQEVIALKCRLQGYLIDEREPGLWTKRHSDRHCSVQINDRGGQELGELSVKRRDALPVSFLGDTGTRMTRGDRGLKGVGATQASQSLSAFEASEATSNEKLIPQGTILIEDQDRLSRRAHTGP